MILSLKLPSSFSYMGISIPIIMGKGIKFVSSGNVFQKMIDERFKQMDYSNCLSNINDYKQSYAVSCAISFLLDKYIERG